MKQIYRPQNKARFHPRCLETSCQATALGPLTSQISSRTSIHASTFLNFLHLFIATNLFRITLACLAFSALLPATNRGKSREHSANAPCGILSDKVEIASMCVEIPTGTIFVTICCGKRFLRTDSRYINAALRYVSLNNARLVARDTSFALPLPKTICNFIGL